MARKQSWAGIIAEEVRAVKDDRGSLRKFGFTMCVALAAFGGLFLWRDRAVAPYLFGLAAAFAVAAAAAPTALKPIHKTWMTLAIVLGWVMTRVLLVLVFFVGITPVALVAKAARKRFLALEFEPDSKSYWERKPKPEEGIERYERQF